MIIAGAAHAGEPEPTTAVWTGVDFDLTRDCGEAVRTGAFLVRSAFTQQRRSQSLTDLDSRDFGRDELAPHWTYQPSSEGPVLEFATLGAGKKGRPKLAHLAIAMDF